MNLYINPNFTVTLTIALVYLSMGVYLLRWKQRTRASFWLTVFILTQATLSLGWSLGSVFPLSLVEPWVEKLSSFLTIAGLSVQVLAILQFAFYYKQNIYKVESSIAFYLSAFLTGFHLVANAVNSSQALLFATSTFYFIGGILWAVVVFVRKTIWYSRQAAALGKPKSAVFHFLYVEDSTGRICRSFSGFSFLFLLLQIIQMLIWFIPNALGISYEVAPLIILFASFWLFITFTNDKEQRTSVLIKLVGIVLLVVMSGFSVISISMFGNDWIINLAGLPPLSEKTIRFEPDPADPSRYRQESIPYFWREGDGEILYMEDETDQVIKFGFTFPFYGINWHDAYVNSNGILTFGERIGNRTLPIFQPTQFYSNTPKIALLYTDLDPSRGRVSLQSGTDSLTITWENVPFFQSGDDAGVSVQMTLLSNGVIELTYQHMPDERNKSLTQMSSLQGIHPGSGAGTGRSITYKSDQTVYGEPLGPVYEDRFLLIARAAHPAGFRMMLIVLTGFVFVLLVYPWLLRGSILKPLNNLIKGVDCVKQGETDFEIHQASGDEFGVLTVHFNEMTASLTQASQQLKAYAGTLESKVEERTRELRKSLDDLQRAQQQLIQSEKMASLGQLTAGIAHEIKNPLNFVNNFSELSVEILDEIRLGVEKFNGQIPASFKKELYELLDDIRVHQEKINKHGRRADGIVQSMLAHSRNAPGERRMIDLNKFADEFIGLAYHGIRSTNNELNVLIKRDYDPCVEKVELMPQGMGQVLVNLLNNALYAVMERAKLMDSGYKPAVVVSTSCEEGWVKLGVQDNGVGIPGRLHDKIFEPFFTTKPAGSGTGLGLSLSYEIITKGHGGRLEVESEEGEGSRFTIMLPLPAEPNEFG